MSGRLYDDLARFGFRRSGEFIYRPRCDGCQACTPLRIDVQAFQPSRSQRRAWQRHQGLAATVRQAQYDPEHMGLYARYVYARHPDTWLEQNLPEGHLGLWQAHALGTTTVEQVQQALRGHGHRRAGAEEADRLGADSQPDFQPAFSPAFEMRYREFLLRSCVPTQLVEFRDPPMAGALSSAGTLRMVCVVDVLAHGLSAVYTFFDPAQTRDSLGTYAILWQIAHARRLGLPYVYLGYWVQGSPTMDYKRRFQPCEIWQGGQWQRMQASDKPNQTGQIIQTTFSGSSGAC